MVNITEMSTYSGLSPQLKFDIYVLSLVSTQIFSFKLHLSGSLCICNPFGTVLGRLKLQGARAKMSVPSPVYLW